MLSLYQDASHITYHKILNNWIWCVWYSHSTIIRLFAFCSLVGCKPRTSFNIQIFRIVIPLYVIVWSLEKRAKYCLVYMNLAKNKILYDKMCGIDTLRYRSILLENRAKENSSARKHLKLDRVSIKFYPNWERAQTVNFTTETWDLGVIYLILDFHFLSRSSRQIGGDAYPHCRCCCCSSNTSSLSSSCE